MSKHIHLVGFGSQGTAWAENLRLSGWRVEVYLGRREGASHERATALGFNPALVEDLPLALANDSADVALVAMMCPDHLIGPLYNDIIARAARPVLVILAHGYAVYAGELRAERPDHAIGLLAPKAIGPKLAAAFKASSPEPHRLVAGFHAPAEKRELLARVAHGLGFSDGNLVASTFEQEAIGDLISEQTLLCGGVFNLLEWTMQAMTRAGVPPRLVREECLTELELIAGLIRERGAASTLGKISQAAQCGTIAMREKLEQAGVPGLIEEQAQSVIDRRFVDYARDEEHWRPRLEKLKAELKAEESK